MWRRTTGWVDLSVLRRSIDAAGPPIPMGSLYVGAGLCSSIGASWCACVPVRPPDRAGAERRPSAKDWLAGWLLG